MKQTTIYGTINIVPLNMPVPDDETDDRTPADIEAGVPYGGMKQIILVDPQSGEQFIYSMDEGLALEVAKTLKMSNKALHYKYIEIEKQRRTQELLGASNGGGPGAEQLVHDIMRGATDPRRAKQ